MIAMVPHPPVPAHGGPTLGVLIGQIEAGLVQLLFIALCIAAVAIAVALLASPYRATLTLGAPVLLLISGGPVLRAVGCLVLALAAVAWLLTSGATPIRPVQAFWARRLCPQARTRRTAGPS